MTSSLNAIFSVSFFILIYPLIVNTELCPPAEEYQPYTLSCPTNNYKTVWKASALGSSSVLSDIADCRYTPCYIVNPDYLNVTWNSSLSTLTFKNLSRTNPLYPNEYFCYQLQGTKNSPSEVLISSCNLDNKIFVRPDKPACKKQSLSFTTVSLTCRTNKIFPQAGCRFYSKTTALQGKVTYINGNLNNVKTDYYQPNCSIELSLGSDIGPGVHQFKVLMYPDVAGGDKFGAESDFTSELILTLPSASLSTSCSNNVNVTDNYIKEGTTVTCQCNKVKDGNQPGWVEWIDSSKSNQLVSNDTTTAVMTIIGDRRGPSPDFTCRGRSALGVHISGVFKKNIAFGPNTLRILQDKVDDLCPPNPSISLTVYCEVPVTSVKPEPVFTVSINNLPPFSEINVTNTTHYRWKSEFTLTTSGKHQVTCLATNSEFSTIQKQDSKSVEIREPPTSDPLIRLANGNVLDNGETASVIEGDIITCYVEGGYPPANVTFTCESVDYKMSTVQGAMEVSMDISAYKNKTYCTCTAISTVCSYRKTSWFTFNNIEKTSSSSSTDVAGIVGAVIGCFLAIVLVVVIIFVLKRKGKLSSCPKRFTGHEKHEENQLSDKSAKVDDTDFCSFRNPNPNEAYESLDNDGYEVPVAPRLASDYENNMPATNTDNEVSMTPQLASEYENSLSATTTDSQIPTVKSKPGKNATNYENVV